MKYTIRENVWETNSSSMHAIAISKTNVDLEKNVFPYYGVVHFNHGEFGWEHSIYGDVDSKASYLYQALFEVYPTDKYIEDDKGKHNEKDRSDLINWIYTVLGKYRIEAVFDTDDYDEDGWREGYIDHGYELDDFLKYVLGNEKHLLNYLFGNSLICTSNDNDDMDDFNEFVDHYENKNYKLIVKGN